MFGSVMAAAGFCCGYAKDTLLTGAMRGYAAHAVIYRGGASSANPECAAIKQLMTLAADIQCGQWNNHSVFSIWISSVALH